MRLFFERHDLASYLYSDHIQFRLLQSSLWGFASKHYLKQLIQYVQLRLLISLSGKDHFFLVLQDAH